MSGEQSWFAHFSLIIADATSPHFKISGEILAKYSFYWTYRPIPRFIPRKILRTNNLHAKSSRIMT